MHLKNKLNWKDEAHKFKEYNKPTNRDKKSRHWKNTETAEFYLTFSKMIREFPLGKYLQNWY